MQNEIPLIDCPIDYIFGEASGKVLNEYMRFPCKIKCGVYAFMAAGTARATVNITQYEFQENDVLYLSPNSFFRVHEFSEDARVLYIVLSSSSFNMRRVAIINSTTFTNGIAAHILRYQSAPVMVTLLIGSYPLTT